MTDAEELLTVKAAAQALAVSPRTVEAWIRKGAMRAKRIGPPGSKKKSLRITRAELQRHVSDASDR